MPAFRDCCAAGDSRRTLKSVEPLRASAIAAVIARIVLRCIDRDIGEIAAAENAAASPLDGMARRAGGGYRGPARAPG